MICSWWPVYDAFNCQDAFARWEARLQYWWKEDIWAANMSHKSPAFIFYFFLSYMHVGFFTWRPLWVENVIIVIPSEEVKGRLWYNWSWHNWSLISLAGQPCPVVPRVFSCIWNNARFLTFFNINGFLTMFEGEVPDVMRTLLLQGKKF